MNLPVKTKYPADLNHVPYVWEVVRRQPMRIFNKKIIYNILGAAPHEGLLTHQSITALVNINSIISFIGYSRDKTAAAKF